MYARSLFYLKNVVHHLPTTLLVYGGQLAEWVMFRSSKVSQKLAKNSFQIK
jgi:hypothetical protein